MEEKVEKANVREVFCRLWPTLRPYRMRFLLGLVFILSSTTIEVVMPEVVGRAVDSAANLNSKLLLHLSLLFLFLVVLRTLIEFGQGFVIQVTGQLVMHDLRSLVFKRIESFPVAYFDRNPTGRLLTRVINDIKSLSELFTASMSVIALDALIILGTIMAMFAMNFRLAAVVLATFPIVLFSVRYFGNWLAGCYRRVRIKLSEINAFLGENLVGIATIQRLAAEDERLKKFRSIVNAHNDSQMESVHVYALVQPVTNVLNGISIASLLIVGGYWVIDEKITIGVLVAFLGYIRNLFQPIRDLVEKYNTFLSSMVSGERVLSILREESEWETNGTFALGRLGESVDIRFVNVSLKYPTRTHPSIEQVSFVLPAGKSIAVVGATGSGKSTLIRLLLRFYEPTSGQIYFGDRDIRDIDKKSLRSHIGVVHQEIYLFKGTIRENLTLHQPIFPDEKLIEECRRAQLWDYVKARGGLDFMVEEGGANLSLGERQLMSFARVLAFNPPVLILDEATSSVDPQCERRLMEAIHEVIVGRTSLVVAHRLSTIQQCDSVLVMEKGKLIESGNIDFLIGKKGSFARFHEIHSRGIWR